MRAPLRVALAEGNHKETTSNRLVGCVRTMFIGKSSRCPTLFLNPRAEMEPRGRKRSAVAAHRAPWSIKLPRTRETLAFSSQVTTDQRSHYHPQKTLCSYRPVARDGGMAAAAAVLAVFANTQDVRMEIKPGELDHRTRWSPASGGSGQCGATGSMATLTSDPRR